MNVSASSIEVSLVTNKEDDCDDYIVTHLSDHRHYDDLHCCSITSLYFRTINTLGTFRSRTTNVNVYDNDNDILSYVTVNNVLYVSFDKCVNVYDITPHCISKRAIRFVVCSCVSVHRVRTWSCIF